MNKKGTVKHLALVLAVVLIAFFGMAGASKLYGAQVKAGYMWQFQEGGWTMAFGSQALTGAATTTVTTGIHDILMVSCSVSNLGASAPPSYGPVCVKSATSTTPYAFDAAVPGASGSTTVQWFVIGKGMEH